METTTRRRTTVSLPAAETLAAFEEARSGAEMEEMTDYDIEHFEEFVARL